MDGKTFKGIRRRLGKTQLELADLIGVHRVSVACWEAGIKPISARTALLMALLDRERKGKRKRDR